MAINGVRVAGNPGPIRVSTQTTKFAFDLPEVVNRWRGERIATFSAFNKIAFRTSRAVVFQDGASATIETTTKEASIVEIAELDFNSAQREWWTAPPYATLSASDRFKVNAALKALSDFSSHEEDAATIAGFFDDLADDFPDPFGSILEDVYLNGETFLTLLPVVTFTQIGAQWTIQDSKDAFVIEDVGLLFTTAQVLDIVPENFQSQITAVVNNSIAANSSQTLAWLKSGRYSVASDGNIHLMQQFVFDAYATNRYTFA